MQDMAVRIFFYIFKMPVIVSFLTVEGTKLMLVALESNSLSF